MKISSVRLGHANNSSSTHSIILNSKSGPVPSESGDFQYGWDWFHLTTRDDKSKYLAAMIHGILSQEMGSAHAAIVARELTGANILEHVMAKDGDGYERSAYVDHQSVPGFPRSYESVRYGHKGHYDHDFMREMVDYVLSNPKITIHGGNDNTDEDEKNANDVGGKALLTELNYDVGSNHPLICRKDGDWWILYNRESGAKIRLSFKENPKIHFPKGRPELVDIKITDYCPYGCKFCYQSSTKEGKHADFKRIEGLAWALQDARVFEVALGGGETTSHPDFAKILESFHNNGVTPNFTTFNLSWMEDEAKVAAVKKYCRSFAVSSIQDLRSIAWWIENEVKSPSDVRPTLQIPLGCYKKDELTGKLAAAHELGIDVTFLGYKNHGRGEVFKPEAYDWIIDWLAEQPQWNRFGADSVFVDQFKDRLKEKGVSEKLMVNKEGMYSCYIDAVNLQMGASSYTKELHDVPADQKALFCKFPYAG